MTCRVGGSEMMDEACETCIRWFGKSSAVTECERCGREYGGYPLVENALALTLRLAVGDVPWNPRQHCPDCRIAAHAAGDQTGPDQFGTLVDLAAEYLKRGAVTKSTLVYAQLGLQFVSAAASAAANDPAPEQATSALNQMASSLRRVYGVGDSARARAHALVKAESAAVEDVVAALELGVDEATLRATIEDALQRPSSAN